SRLLAGCDKKVGFRIRIDAARQRLNYHGCLPHNPRVKKEAIDAATKTVNVAPLSRSAVLHRSLNKTYPVAVRGEGVWLFDSEGHKILDFASAAVVNFI